MGWIDGLVEEGKKPDTTLVDKQVDKLISSLGMRVAKDESGRRVAVPAARSGVSDFSDEELLDFVSFWSSPNFRRVGEEDGERLNRYEAYQRMDGVMSEAIMTLDAYADEVVASGFAKDVLKVEVKGDKKLQKELDQIFEVNDIKSNLRGLARSLCKWGDLGFRISKFNDVLTVDQIPPTEWEALVFPGTKKVFQYRYLEGRKEQELVDLLPRHRTHGRDREEALRLDLHEFTHLSLSDVDWAPYGRSILEPMRLVSDQLMTIEALLALTRANRVERLVLRVPTATADPTSAFAKLQHIRSALKGTLFSENNKQKSYGKVPAFTDVLLYPSDNGFDIDRLSSGLEISDIDDVEYFRDKVLLGSGLEKGYFLADEESERGSALAAQNLKFARKLIHIQQAIATGLSRLCLILSAYLGANPETVNVRVIFQLPALSSNEIINNWLDAISTAQSILEGFREFVWGEDYDEEEKGAIITDDAYYALLTELGLPIDIINILEKGYLDRNKERKSEKEEEGKVGLIENRDRRFRSFYTVGKGRDMMKGSGDGGGHLVESTSINVRKDPFLLDSLKRMSKPEGVRVDGEEMAILKEEVHRRSIKAKSVVNGDATKERTKPQWGV